MSHDCQMMMDLIMDYQRLDVDRRELVDRHVNTCEECRREFEHAQQLDSVFDGVAIEAPADLADNVIDAIHEAPREKESWGVLPHVLAFVAVEAVLVLAIRVDWGTAWNRLHVVAGDWLGRVSIAVQSTADRLSFSLPRPEAVMTLDLAWVFAALAAAVLMAGAILYQRGDSNAN